MAGDAVIPAALRDDRIEADAAREVGAGKPVSGEDAASDVTAQAAVTVDADRLAFVQLA